MRHHLHGGNIGDDINSLGAKIKNEFENPDSMMRLGLKDTGQKFENAFDPNKNGLKASIDHTVEALKGIDWSHVGQEIKDGLDPAKNGVKAAFDKFGADLKKAFQALGDKMLADWKHNKEVLDAAFAPLVHEFTDGNSVLGKFIREQVGTAEDWKRKFEDPDTYFTIISILLTAAAAVVTAPIGGVGAAAVFAALQTANACTKVIVHAAQGKPFNPMDVVDVVACAAGPAVIGKFMSSPAGKAVSAVGTSMSNAVFGAAKTAAPAAGSWLSKAAVAGGTAAAQAAAANQIAWNMKPNESAGKTLTSITVAANTYDTYDESAASADPDDGNAVIETDPNPENGSSNFDPNPPKTLDQLKSEGYTDEQIQQYMTDHNMGEYLGDPDARYGPGGYDARNLGGGRPQKRHRESSNSATMVHSRPHMGRPSYRAIADPTCEYLHSSLHGHGPGNWDETGQFELPLKGKGYFDNFGQKALHEVTDPNSLARASYLPGAQKGLTVAHTLAKAAGPKYAGYANGIGTLKGYVDKAQAANEAARKAGYGMPEPETREIGKIGKMGPSIFDLLNMQQHMYGHGEPEWGAGIHHHHFHHHHHLDGEGFFDNFGQKALHEVTDPNSLARASYLPGAQKGLAVAHTLAKAAGPKYAGYANGIGTLKGYVDKAQAANDAAKKAGYGMPDGSNSSEYATQPSPSNDTFSNEEMKTIASSAYSSAAATGNMNLDNNLLGKTRTLVFYAKPGSHTIVVGVRGTQDLKDVYSDVLLGLPFRSAFENSSRVKESINDLQEFQKKYPMPTYTYIGAGHSLGGAVIDVMLAKKLISSARTYNPAQSVLDVVGKKDANLYQSNQRVYNNKDWLYNMGNAASYLTGNKSLKDRGADVRQDSTSGANGLAAHGLQNAALAGGARWV